MPKRAVLLFPALFLLILPAVAADKLLTSTINDQISPYDFAEYIITVVNEKPESDSYLLSAVDVRWTLATEPLTDYTVGLDVPAYANRSTRLFVKPREGVSFGEHGIELIATSRESGEVLRAIISVNVRQDLIKWPFDVDASLIIPAYLDPRRTNSIKVELKNKNPLHIKGLVVRLVSSLFAKEATVDLLSNQVKVLDFTIELPPDTEQLTENLTVSLFWNNSLVKEISQSYTVSMMGALFREEVSLRKGFLKREFTLTYHNDAAIAQAGEVLVEVGLFKSLFTRSTPKMEPKKIDDRRYLSAALELGPKQAASFVLVTNYRPLLYLLIIVLAVALAYFMLRTPLVVRKEVRTVELEEGGLSRLRIVLRIKNRSKRFVRAARLIDKIPLIARFERVVEGPKPSKSYPFKEGTAIVFELPTLGPDEVRLVSYELKTKLGVLGSLRLKPAIVQYERGRTFSNAVEVYAP